MKQKTPMVSRNILLPFILITSLFFAWGLANNMTDTLLAAFKKIMSMTDLQTSWVQMAFYGAYFCLALPAALIIRRYTYKRGILIGLAMFIGGSLLFFPASRTMVYGHFLVALYILAGGLSILETACNPYVVEMGDPATGTRRLNLAQSFNPIGSITGVLLSKYFILSELNVADAADRAGMSAGELAAVQSAELNAMMGPYVGVALVLLVIWIAILLTKMPKTMSELPENRTDKLGETFRKLLKNKQYIKGVLAQFVYVGAQIGVWSFTIRYVMQEIGVNEAGASSYYLAAIVLLTCCRFVFTALMRRFSPRSLLMFAAVCAVLCTFGVIYLPGYAGVVCLVMISGFMSLMFPTIYGISVEGLGAQTKVASSGLIMAILGGALFTTIQGQVSDMTGSINLSYYVPLCCFALIAFYALTIRKKTA